MTDIFLSTENVEPHASRRNTILSSHPRIKQLMGYDSNTKWWCLFLIFIQIGLAHIVPNFSWKIQFVIAYVFGATITQALFLAVHECAHNLLFASPRHNRFFSIVLNLPVIVPFSIAFRHYHTDHHKHQGKKGIDTDLPSQIELKFVKSPFTKTLWMMFQIVFYAIRPILVGKPPPISKDLLYNVMIQMLFNCVLVFHSGLKPVLYLLVCVLLAGGLHPCAGHFLSEHYVFKEKSEQETFSYYGLLNKLTWNVGYHNEHHDFPNIPGSRLPFVKKEAPEFYDPLIKCGSWSYTIFQFIYNDKYGPWRRIVRHDS